VADIAKRLDLTKQNVFKIVHILSRAGFIAAVRGPSGGVRLASPPSRIRIGDVVRAIEVTHVQVGEDASGEADFGDGSVNTVLDDAMGAFIAVLDQHTLEDMARQEQASSPGRGSRTQKLPAAKRSAQASPRG
jgi:Rrf2 family nitric oxide-sensitive transcriptional repressor